MPYSLSLSLFNEFFTRHFTHSYNSFIIYCVVFLFYLSLSLIYRLRVFTLDFATSNPNEEHLNSARQCLSGNMINIMRQEKHERKNHLPCILFICLVFFSLGVYVFDYQSKLSIRRISKNDFWCCLFIIQEHLMCIFLFCELNQIQVHF